MQLTKLDRWLKERFIYETHIFTLRTPDAEMPKGVSVQPADPSKAGDFKFHLIVKDTRIVDTVINLLKENRIMYSTHIIEGNNWYNRYISPKGRSFTWMWIMRSFTYVCVASACFGLYKLSQNDKVVTLVKGAIAELKKGL